MSEYCQGCKDRQDEIEMLRKALAMIRFNWAGHAEQCARVTSRGKDRCDCDWPKVAAQCDAALAPQADSALPETAGLNESRTGGGIADRCEVCGQALTWEHDHKSDLSGLDDGPPLPGARSKPQPKSPDELRDIRARAWATRRQKHGPHGHR